MCKDRRTCGRVNVARCMSTVLNGTFCEGLEEWSFVWCGVRKDRESASLFFVFLRGCRDLSLFGVSDVEDWSVGGGEVR